MTDLEAAARALKTAIRGYRDRDDAYSERRHLDAIAAAALTWLWTEEHAPPATDREGRTTVECDHEWCATAISTAAGERQGIRCDRCGISREWVAAAEADAPPPSGWEEAFKAWNPALFGIVDIRTRNGFRAGYLAASPPIPAVGEDQIEAMARALLNEAEYVDALGGLHHSRRTRFLDARRDLRAALAARAREQGGGS